MALTVTKVVATPVSVGDRFVMHARVAADTSYPTGGWPLTRANLGFSSVADPEFHVTTAAQGGYVPEYDHTNQKLLLYRQTAATSALVEVPNTTNVSAAVPSLRLTAWGKYV